MLFGHVLSLLSDDWRPQVFSKSIAAMTVTVTGEPDEFEKIAHKVRYPEQRPTPRRLECTVTELLRLLLSAQPATQSSTPRNRRWCCAHPASILIKCVEVLISSARLPGGPRLPAADASNVAGRAATAAHRVHGARLSRPPQRSAGGQTNVAESLDVIRAMTKSHH